MAKRRRSATEIMQRKIDMLKRIKSETPAKIGKLMVSHFKNSFKIEGFEDEGFQKWQPRKGKWGGFGISKKSDRGRPTLTKTGKLKRSIHISWADWNRVQITSNMPYSAIHNYGGKAMAFGKYPFHMPRRKFMGKSKALHKKVTNLYERAINRAMRA